MTDLIFDIRHEYYMFTFRIDCMTFSQIIILHLKMFVNLFALALVLTMPIVIMFGIIYLVEGYK